MSNTKHEKWLKEFQAIRKEIVELCHSRQIFLSVQDIIDKNTQIQIPSAFWDYLRSTYVAYAVSAVRRLVKLQRDSISFEGLLKDMIASPSDCKQFQGPSGITLNPTEIQKDIDELSSTSDLIENFADKIVSHLDRKPLLTNPTFDELHKSIDLVEKLGCKYLLILTGASSDSMTSVILDDWQAIFRYPWIKAH